MHIEHSSRVASGSECCALCASIDHVAQRYLPVHVETARLLEQYTSYHSCEGSVVPLMLGGFHVTSTHLRNCLASHDCLRKHTDYTVLYAFFTFI